MPFWRIPRPLERHGMRTLHPQGPSLLRQTNLMLGTTGRYGGSARKSEDGAAAAEEKVNGRTYCG